MILHRSSCVWLTALVALFAIVDASYYSNYNYNQDDYYAADDDGNNNNNNQNNNYNNYNNNNNNYNQNNNNNNYNNDDGGNNYNNDDANNNNDGGNDDANNNNDDANNDDANNDDANNDDANNDDANNDDANGNDNYNDDYYNKQGDDDDAQAAAAQDDQTDDDGAAAASSYQNYQDDWAQKNADIDDDLFHWEDNNVGFDGVSIMPVSCIDYNNGHMIKFDFFETDNSYQCHFSQIGTFVVSIAHYMRAYFNHQALVHGHEFALPGDAGYLNCVLLQETAYADAQLYAKIGCMERETFTSTKLALHVYTDEQCSIPYDDGESSRRHATKGYEINGYTFSTRVSFRPPFYTCQTCKPEEISDSFNKKAGTWYDDDYISEHGKKQGNDDGEGEDSDEDEDEDEDGDDANNDDGDGGGDDGNDYYQDDYIDDTYLSANDDISNNGNYDDYYNRQLQSLPSKALVRYEPRARQLTPANGQLKTFENEFWQEVNQQRKLYDDGYDINDWNMCKRVYKYGVWCDEDCRSLDAFRTDRWSGADIILLSIMCTFLTAMMLLVVAKRLKAAQKSRMYNGDDISMPGLPPVAMLFIFVGLMAIIVVMAKLKFVNETLVFAVVSCVLLFIYMLKLTLFDNRRPVLLAAPRHDLFDNPMDQHLFD